MNLNIFLNIFVPSFSGWQIWQVTGHFCLNVSYMHLSLNLRHSGTSTSHLEPPFTQQSWKSEFLFIYLFQIIISIKNC